MTMALSPESSAYTAQASFQMIYGYLLDVYNLIGADELIKDISSHKVVRKLLIDRFWLPDNGWTKVFEYLRALPTSRSEITEIDLRGCLMNDNDLLAISGFLTNDTKLKTLWLQNVSHCSSIAVAPSLILS